MAICTLAQVKGSIGARIDGTEFDADIPRAIAAAQSMIEHECGVAAGAFDTSPNDAVTTCAIAVCVQLIENPAATRDDMRNILGSALLDGVRTWA